MSIITKTPTDKDIYSFFLSLSDNDLYNFSLYPNANTRRVALKLSKTILKDKSQKIFGLFKEGEMIGFGILKFLPKPTMKQICNFGLVITTIHQGRGYGFTLAKSMIHWAKQNNYKKIWLTAYSENIRAIKLYKKLGFQMEGIFMYNEYFGETPRHALSMALFFDLNPVNERKKLWQHLSKTLSLQ